MQRVYLQYFENVSHPTQPWFPVNLGWTSLVLWWCQVRHEKVELDVKNLTYFLQRHLVQMSYLEKHGASNEHDASTHDPRFWGDKQKIQQVRQILGQAKVSWQCRPKYYALHTKMGVIRFHQMLWCHHRNGNLGNSLCWQISIQAVGIPVQHIFYEDLAGNSANLEARISQISTEIHFRPLRSCSAKAVRRFLRQNTSCPPVQLSKAADTQLGLPKFRFGPLLEVAEFG